MNSVVAKLTPQQYKALAEASQWHVELTGESTSQKTQAWQNWLSTQPENQWAWQQLEKLTATTQTAPWRTGI